jgi:hypothetical protein
VPGRWRLGCAVRACLVVVVQRRLCRSLISQFAWGTALAAMLPRPGQVRSGSEPRPSVV